MIFKRSRRTPKFFILDLDGVFTDGAFMYGKNGKEYKTFGPDDHDALRAISNLLDIHVVTADVRGFSISEQRIVHDMNFPLHLVSAQARPDWIEEHFDSSSTVYMGDGFLDHIVFQRVMYGIAPANALKRTREFADFVTSRGGGERAVAEASMHIAKRFFGVSI